MNYELEISQSLPVSFNNLNGNQPPLVAGSGSATLLSALTTQPFQPWTKGLEHEPFSIELWFLPVKVTSELLIVGHSTAGVFWNGSDYILRFEYDNGVVEGRWSPLEVQSSHIVITYDTARADLWVNGELAVSLDVSGGDNFVRIQKTLNLHRPAAGDTAVYDSLALYHRTLSEREIKLHHAWGRDLIESWNIASSKGATTWRLAYEDVNIATSVVFNQNNWGDFFVEGLSVVDNNLAADSPDGGVWMGAFPLGPVVQGASAGVHLTYVGRGVTLSYSTDGTTWTIVPNKTTVLEDADVTDLQFFLKVELSDDTSWISFLRADVIGARTMQPFSGNRALSFKSTAMDQTPGRQLDFHFDSGAQISNGGHVVALADSEAVPVASRAVELWVKFDSLIDGALIDSDSFWLRVGGDTWSAGGSGNTAFYINGSSALQSVVPGVWYHVVLVNSVGTTGPVSFGANDDLLSGQTNPTIGHVALYPNEFTAAEVFALYRANVGAPALTIDDAGEINMTEDAQEPSVFAYSWSYVAGGS